MSISPDQLHVITPISNPMRWKSRYKLFLDFCKHVEDAGAILHVVELTFGEREGISDFYRPNKMQLKTSHELWHKENQINIALSRLPQDAQYIAWIDADVAFTRPDWATETIHELQHYDVVQMFSHAVDLGPEGQPLPVPHFNTSCWPSFAYNYLNNRPMFDGSKTVDKYLRGGHPGYAWAAKRSWLDQVGGLIDYSILGSADFHMACALIGGVEKSFYEGIHHNYSKLLRQWQERAHKRSSFNLGYVRTSLVHHWHGPKARRYYNSRTNILIKNEFDPTKHLWRDAQGLWCLHEEFYQLRDDVRQYFRSRNEDSTEI